MKKISIIFFGIILLFIGVNYAKADTTISQPDHAAQTSPCVNNSVGGSGDRPCGQMIYGVNGLVSSIDLWANNSTGVQTYTMLKVYGVTNLQSFSQFTTSSLTLIGTSSEVIITESGGNPAQAYNFSFPNGLNLTGYPQYFIELAYSGGAFNGGVNLYGTTSTYSGSNGVYVFNLGTATYYPVGGVYPQGNSAYLNSLWFNINFFFGQSINPQSVFQFNIQQIATTTNYWFVVPNCAVQTAGSSTLDQIGCWIKATTYDFLNTMALGVSNIGAGLGNQLITIFPLNLFHDLNTDIAIARASSTQVTNIMIPTNASGTMGFTILKASTAQDIKDKIGSNVQDIAGKIFYILTALGVVVMVGAAIILITKKDA